MNSVGRLSMRMSRHVCARVVAGSAYQPSIGIRRLQVTARQFEKLDAKIEKEVIEESKEIKEIKEINDTKDAAEAVTEKEEIVSPRSLFELGVIAKDLFKAIDAAGFKDFTKVQTKTIAPALEVKSGGLVVRARTGTGKTLAFGIPSLQHAIENVRNDRKVQSLIITPTRDLAIQIQNELTKIIKNLPSNIRHKMTVDCHIGGTRANNLNPKFAPKILIATPGRLGANLSNSNFLNCFSDLKFRVYDESDRLLDIGFTDELYQIDSYLKSVQLNNVGDDSFSSLLFSATVDDSVQKFARDCFGGNYQYIDCVDKNELEAVAAVEQTLIKTENLTESYIGCLDFICENLQKKNFKAVMFLPTTGGVDYTYDILTKLVAQHNSELTTEENSVAMNRNIMLLHGKRSQSQRDRTVKKFTTAKSGLLITTDVGARGLDFNSVSDVIQISPSQTPADYIHKIGRTARAGKSGKAIIFLSRKEMSFVNQLKDLRKVAFNNVYDYKHNEELKAKIQKFLVDELFEAEAFCKAYMSYINNIKSKYRLNHTQIIQQLADLYKFLANDESAKMMADDKFTKMQLGLSFSAAEEIFDFRGSRYGGSRRDGGSRSGGFNDRGRSFRGNDDRNFDRRGGSDRNFDKRGGSDRNFDRRGGSNNRSYGNRSYDRNDKSYNRDDRSERSYHKKDGDRSGSSYTRKEYGDY